ncbi:hypothetical protein COCMIDRAFT_88055 [Bipolaris oryzae ATCC 44560]|uniref:Uncharacterized protein n=1 Tax=Bipolaris oryzae ATCC 44560 TaxID=930090 RepID=W6ZDQ5_COCMI|nr:uncharacterized protein COCMIDRAFT_88055 [Bipolaris oryzae ATCC 44560]EUC48125.1 hypothetical protein COCMIDRAFT_88055 [Bipolaris oryzae ATCC 44560]
MKFTTAFLLAASVNVITALTASFDGCNYNGRGATSYANGPCTKEICGHIDCQMACHQAGIHDSPNDYYLGVNYNGYIQNSCSCVCYKR